MRVMLNCISRNRAGIQLRRAHQGHRDEFDFTIEHRYISIVDMRALISKLQNEMNTMVADFRRRVYFIDCKLLISKLLPGLARARRVKREAWLKVRGAYIERAKEGWRGKKSDFFFTTHCLYYRSCRSFYKVCSIVR